MINVIDELQLYFGDDYIINDYITIHQPTIEEIVRYGEQKYFSTAATLSAIPSDMKAELDDAGYNYMELSDFELFIMLTRTIAPDRTSIWFGEFDFTAFDVAVNPENQELILINQEGVVIDQLIYQLMINYIRKLHGIVPKVEKAQSEFTRQILIQEAREKLAIMKDKPYESVLLPLISAMTNSAGFKYNASQVRNVKLYEFMDSVKRIQCIAHASSLIQGCYSGNVDAKKINKKDLDWMRKLK